MSTPSAPKIFIRPDAVAPNQLDFYWGSPTSDGGSAITSYILQMTSPSTFTKTISPSADQTSVYDLVDGTQYSFTLAASNTNGIGTAAAFRSVYVGSPPGIIGDVGVIPVNPTLHQVSWTRTFGDGYAPTIYHAIHSYPADTNGNPIYGSPSTIVTPAFGNQFTAQIRNLNSSIAYVHLPQAINDPGYSPATSFTPAVSTGSLTVSTTRGLTCWLNGDAAVSTVQSAGGSTILGWNDSGLLGNNIIGINNGANMRYDADSGSVLSLGGATLTLSNAILPNDNSDFSIFYVFNLDKFAYQTIFKKDNLLINYWDNIQESIIFPSLGGWLYGPATPTNTTFITQIDYTSSAVVMYRNGSPVASTVGAFDRTDTSQAEAYLFGGNNDFWGTISEFMMFNRKVSEYERGAITQYLGSKYEIYPFYSPPYTNFQPNQITGLRLWLDAKDASTFTFSSGSNISVWADKSPYHNDASGGIAPLYNSSSNLVAFDDANKYLDLPDNTLPGGNSPFTVFIVEQSFYGTSVNNYLLSAGTTQSDELSFATYPVAGQAFMVYDATILQNFNSQQYFTPRIYAFAYQPGNQDIYINNNVVAQSNVASRNGQSVNTRLGWVYANLGQKYLGDVYEILVYDSRLNERDMNTVYEYLRKKYF